MATFLFFSNTIFSPRIPISATCCSTYCGMSSSLRKRSSTGKFFAVVFNTVYPVGEFNTALLKKFLGIFT